MASVSPSTRSVARDYDEDREGRAGLALAVLAVADGRHQGLAVAAVGQASAQATPVEEAGHHAAQAIDSSTARIETAPAFVAAMQGLADPDDAPRSDENEQSAPLRGRLTSWQLGSAHSFVTAAGGKRPASAFPEREP